MLTQERMQNLLKLAALDPENLPLDVLAKNLDDILAYMADLESVDTTGVDLSQVHSSLIPRLDEASERTRSEADRLLSVSPQRVIAHQIAVPSIL